MSELKVGDKIRILVDRHNQARVVEGDILTVQKVHPYSFETESPRLKWNAGWVFDYEDEGTGWEKYEGEK